jgi:uncharacterized RDD family membrane protein YckC
MRCPKCQYLSFDNGERCRNCGYEFSLVVAAAPLDLAIQDGTEPLGPLVDLTLHGEGETSPSRAAVDVPPAETDTGGLELPLFTARGREQPLVTPASPRAPLSVRRGAPVPSKPKAPHAPRTPRPAVDEPLLELEAEPPQPRPAAMEHAAEQPAFVRTEQRSSPRESAPPPDVTAGPASTPARVFAAIIDLAIVGGIDAAVLYLTLRVLEMHMAEARALPLVPFIAFLALLNGSYFAAFIAASGQTIGKMAAGIRVVPGDGADSAQRVSIGTAIVRAAAYVVSALPAGLGFLPGVIGKDHRALHDRLADTRVVKA